MTRCRNLRTVVRWLCRALTGALLLVAAACVALYAGAKVYQHRAETLYERVKAFQVGATGWAEVQKLATDYRRNLVLDSEPCGPDNCAFTIRLNNSTFPTFYDAPVMWRFGIRPTFVAAMVRVREGKLTYSSFAIYTRTQHGYWLEASFHAAPELTMYDRCSSSFLGRNSTYTVMGGHLTNGDCGGRLVRTAFGATAPGDERNRATEMRLNCITAIPSCERVTDLIPMAYQSVSFEPNVDKSFTKECRDYARRVETGKAPRTATSAFYPDGFSLETWTIMRSDE